MPSYTYLIAALLWGALFSFYAVFLMFVDKRRAVKQQWRIPEATMLFVFFIGGAIGGRYAQRKFRHKTRKQPFAILLKIAVFLNLVCVLGVVYLVLSV
ncbi:DUF1294 domain-containing protein [Aestuariibius sp. HNIBRBA575]|uniref:DUF1294 domain-containing protein n=1 Tax=Aestuariibius sp. HNIBRBA575 TaxID=3233343 RepID=UPI0034A45564